MSPRPQPQPLVICPGFHPHCWTDYLIAALSPALAVAGPQQRPWQLLRSPTILNGAVLRQYLQEHLGPPGNTSAQPIFLGFSAGCVSAATLARYWRDQGQGATLLCVDGWGVPLDAAATSYRLSHDRFTHQTSAWLGAGKEAFYADPPVPHGLMWQQPQRVLGWWTGPHHPPRRATAIACLAAWLTSAAPTTDDIPGKNIQES